jgi:hypothetical protein
MLHFAVAALVISHKAVSTPEGGVACGNTLSNWDMVVESFTGALLAFVSSNIVARPPRTPILRITGIDDTSATAVIQRGVDDGIPMVLVVALFLGIVQSLKSTIGKISGSIIRDDDSTVAIAFAIQKFHNFWLTLLLGTFRVSVLLQDDRRPTIVHFLVAYHTPFAFIIACTRFQTVTNGLAQVTLTVVA